MTRPPLGTPLSRAAPSRGFRGLLPASPAPGAPSAAANPVHLCPCLQGPPLCLGSPHPPRLLTGTPATASSGTLRATSSELLTWTKALPPSKVAGGHECGGTVINPNIQAARWGVGSMQGGCGGLCPASRQGTVPQAGVLALCAPSRVCGLRAQRPGGHPCAHSEASGRWRGGSDGTTPAGGPGSSLGGSCLEQGCGGPVLPSLGPQPAALTHPTASAWPLASGWGEGTLGARWTPGRWALRGRGCKWAKGRGCK